MARARKTTRSPQGLPAWERLARRRLSRLLDVAQKIPSVRKLGPRADWRVELTLVDARRMTALNSRYRGKAYPTDVLSFPAPEPFLSGGYLGELAICLPTLKRQARELGHPPQAELEVLLVHGLLHLLGLDHEKGGRQATRMAALEKRVLAASGAGRLGLIARSNA